MVYSKPAALDQLDACQYILLSVGDPVPGSKPVRTSDS